MSGRKHLALLLAVLAAVVLAVTSLTAKAPAPVDPDKDNLPPGAVARIGEVRLTHGGQVECLAFSPDGKLLATTGRDGLLRVWDVATGREKRRFNYAEDKLTSLVQQLAWSPDGKTLALSGQFAFIRLLDADTLKERETLATNGQKGASPIFAFAPDSQTIVWWANDGIIRLYDLNAKKEIRNWPGVRGHIPRFAFAADGKKLAVVNSLVTSVLDVATGNEIVQYQEEQYSPYALTFSPDGKTLALGGFSDVRLCDLTAKDKAPANGSRHQAPIQWLGFAADGKTLYSSSHDGEVKEWDMTAGKETRSFKLIPDKGTGNPISTMAYAPDGKTLAWVAWNNRVRLTKLTTGEELLAEEDKPQAGPFAFTPDGKHLVTPAPDGKPRLWDAATGKLVRRFESTGDATPYFLALSADGKKLVTVGKDVIVWDVATGKETKRLENALPRIGATAALSADGKWLALGDLDLTRGPIGRECNIRWWDLETGKQVGSSTASHLGSVEALAFAPDGKTLASAGVDLTVRVWEVSTGKQLASVQSLKGLENRLAYGDGGKTLLSAARFFDGSVSVVRVTERAPDTAKEGKAHDFTAQSFAAFAPDGSRVALLSLEKGILVLDLASEKTVVEWKGNQGTVGYVAFSADGKKLATGGSDGTILIWDIARAPKP